MVDIWTPPHVPELITIYIDESYFDRNTGLIQAAIPVPAGYVKAFQSRVAELRDQNPHFHSQEFKGGKITKGNAGVYKKFLRDAMNLSAIISDNSPLRTVITVESTQSSRSNEYQWVLDQVTGAFHELGIDHAPTSQEFARKVVWLWRYLKDICCRPVKNSFRVIVDEKYRDADECRSLKPTLNTNGVVIRWPHWKHLTNFLNTLLKEMRPKHWAPHVAEFRFEKSQGSLFLQAADVLANIFYNAMKYGKGIVDDNTTLKYELFRSFMDGPLDSRLLNELDVTTRADSHGIVHKCLVCANPALKCSMRLI